ncbi:hypothetical protein GALMADRAFT_212372 [Galerina marginata CBS 339.88]|uniref:Uncharacterized protein n=1 Tax=Galerina marginata (strain CBS 339.88) TaxID=685588 RepID=A0A067T0R0_GALM3|nr:hypothetical protein GALMADRAFT_212372 [Galerina marginata CBS 339.88]
MANSTCASKTKAQWNYVSSNPDPKPIGQSCLTCLPCPLWVHAMTILSYMSQRIRSLVIDEGVVLPFAPNALFTLSRQKRDEANTIEAVAKKGIFGHRSWGRLATEVKANLVSRTIASGHRGQRCSVKGRTITLNKRAGRDLLSEFSNFAHETLEYARGPGKQDVTAELHGPASGGIQS